VLRRLATVLVAVAAVGPSTAAAAPPVLPDLFTPAPNIATPLPHIGRTRTSICGPIVAPSQDAVQSILGNDATLDDLLVKLPTLHMDQAPRPKQETQLAALRKTASDLQLTAREGLRDTARMRAYAETLNDSGKRYVLNAYVDALEDALHTQDKAGADLARGLVIAEARRSAYQSDLEMIQQMPAQAGTQSLDDPGTYKELTDAVSDRLGDYRNQTKQTEKTIAKRVSDVGC
jgi:hypothetical protein